MEWPNFPPAIDGDFRPAGSMQPSSGYPIGAYRNSLRSASIEATCRRDGRRSGLYGLLVTLTHRIDISMCMDVEPQILESPRGFTHSRFGRNAIELPADSFVLYKKTFPPCSTHAPTPMPHYVTISRCPPPLRTLLGAESIY